METANEPIREGRSSDDASNKEATRKPSRKETVADASPEKKPSWPKRVWDKLGLNPGILILMIKGACPPLIATAIYQATSVAQTFTTIGYLIAIMSILSFSILPRSKFFQTMILNIFSVCIGAAIALLTVYCSVQARIHTTPIPELSSSGPAPGASVVPYNSSASAVSGIWLFFNIMVANSFRASRPQLQFPVIIYSIFANVSGTYAPQFPTMTAGIAFVKKLTEAFLAGFAIATGVNLFVFPISSRDVVFKDATGYIKAVQGALKAQTGYLRTLEDEDMFSPQDKPEQEELSKVSLQAKKLKAAISGLTAIHGKMHGDLSFGKKEVAWGKLDAEDLSEIFKLFRATMLPLVGMSSIADIFDRLAERRGWKKDYTSSESSLDDSEKETRNSEVKSWNEILRSVHDPFEAMTEALHQGLEHVSITLELTKKPKGNSSGNRNQDPAQTIDLEAQDEPLQAGEKGFVARFQSNLDNYSASSQETLKVWCRQKGIDLPEGDIKSAPHMNINLENTSEHKRDYEQLYLILYMQCLLHSVGQAVLVLVKFADEKVESGVMGKKRLILPGKRRVKKWIMNVFKAEDSANDHTPDQNETGTANIYVGGSLSKKRKDPEHLPPTNAWQRFGDGIRWVPHILRSAEVAFGFRVACATMSIAITAYLRVSQQFFVEQRLVWAMIMVAIGMTVTAGAGVFGFLSRVAGTTIAMIMSFIIWYVSGGRGAVGGVLALLYFAIFLELYFLLKFPRFVPAAMITMVTQVLILGYELEVRKIGVALASSSGQLYYPLYLLGPYRLATVTGGCLVGFIWLYFPYPINSRSQLRQDLGASLYLLANYYSCVHTTIRMRLQGKEDFGDKHSHSYKLERAREKIFSKEMALLAGLRQHSGFTAFEFTFGGKFPRKQYDTIIQEVQSILFYIALVGYASRSYSRALTSMDPSRRKWVSDLSNVVSSVNVTTQEITAMLTLLCASVTNGSPLPPFLKAPVPYQFATKLQAIDPDILSINHIMEPGYASFAVTQVATSLVIDDLEKLIENVKALVGEVDFTFHPLVTPDSSNESVVLGDNDRDKGKRD